MINGLEGIPGSGKSYEATVYHVLEALKRGRLVVTNLPLVVPMFEAIDPAYGSLIEIRRRCKPIRGTWDANRMDENGNGHAFELWPDGRTEAPAESVALFGHVWDYYHEWKHPKTGQGPLFIIDECHVPLPKVGTDVQVVQWFKLHRHFNADVLLMTQSFRDMCNGIAVLLAMLTRCRKADFLGKPNHYVRKVFAGFRGALVSSEQREYRAEFFPLYKSHTQGNSVGEAAASDVSPFLVKWKRFTRVWLVLSALLIIGFAWWLATKPDKARVAKKAAPVAVAPAAAPPVVAASAPVAAASQPGQQPDIAEKDPEPFADKGVHLKGHIQIGAKSMYVFVVSQNGQSLQSFSDAELIKAGYVFRPLGDCIGSLEWKGKVRAVTCDLPVVHVINARKG